MFAFLMFHIQCFLPKLKISSHLDNDQSIFDLNPNFPALIKLYFPFTPRNVNFVTSRYFFRGRGTALHARHDVSMSLTVPPPKKKNDGWIRQCAFLDERIKDCYKRYLLEEINSQEIGSTNYVDSLTYAGSDTYM